ncbi:MAG: hypothetical protein ACI9R7_002709, partial [Lysobacterales bacterium]
AGFLKPVLTVQSEAGRAKMHKMSLREYTLLAPD